MGIEKEHSSASGGFLEIIYRIGAIVCNGVHVVVFGCKGRSIVEAHSELDVTE